MTNTPDPAGGTSADGEPAGSRPEGPVGAPVGVDADAVDRLRSFAAGHGGDAVAVIEHLGRVGARIVVVAGDGEFGDALVGSVRDAARVCEAAGIPVREWDRELTARVTPTPADRVRMGGRTH